MAHKYSSKVFLTNVDCSETNKNIAMSKISSSFYMLNIYYCSISDRLADYYNL